MNICTTSLSILLSDLYFKRRTFIANEIWIRERFQSRSFPGGSAGKESAYNAGDPGSIPGLGRSPGGGSGLPIPVFWPGEFRGQRSLAGYSLWGRKELDMTERISLHTSERKDLPRPECSSCLNSIHLVMPHQQPSIPLCWKIGKPFASPGYIALSHSQHVL